MFITKALSSRQNITATQHLFIIQGLKQPLPYKTESSVQFNEKIEIYTCLKSIKEKKDLSLVHFLLLSEKCIFKTDTCGWTTHASFVRPDHRSVYCFYSKLETIKFVCGTRTIYQGGDLWSRKVVRSINLTGQCCLVIQNHSNKSLDSGQLCQTAVLRISVYQYFIVGHSVIAL